MTVAVKRSQLRPIVVAVDPAVTSGEDADCTGIVVVARGPHLPELCKLTGPCPGHGYVLDDLTCKLPPSEWARRAVGAFDKWDASRIVAEVNNGGDMVGETIRAIRGSIPYEAVRATKGKLMRAEPASSMYAQGRVHHMGSFPDLEEQMSSWAPDSRESPDRLDALVWGLTALKLIHQPFEMVFAPDAGDLTLNGEPIQELNGAYAILPEDAHFISTLPARYESPFV